MEEKTVNCSGLDINYVDEGEGLPMIFIHNGGGFWQIWTKQIEYFSKSYRTIALDLPGFGNSDESLHAYNLEFYTSVVIEFIDKLGINEMVLVGNCIGASISINYKNQFPEKVKKLILMNICPGERLMRFGVFRTLIFGTKSQKGRLFLEKILAFAFIKSPIKNKFPAILFGKNPDKKSPLFLKYIEKFKEDKQTRSRLNLLFASNSFTLKKFLNKTDYTKGALLLWGENNQVASLKREGCYHQKTCNISQIHIVENAGHLLMYESPDKVNALLEQFIS